MLNLDFFIKRPVLAISLNLMLFFTGLFAFTALNVRQYPRSDVSTVKVQTIYVGADADLVRGFVTTPLERVIASADGIDYLESASAQGLSTITAHLKLNYDVNSALTQIQSKVAQVRNDLPTEAEAPTIDVESADNRIASMYLSFYSDNLAENEITDYLIRVVQPKISAISGVQKADVLGGRTFAMRIWLKTDRLAAYKLSSLDVTQSLLKNNYLAALGNTKGQLTVTSLKADSNLTSKSEFEDLIVKQSETTVVRVKDIADVELGAENYDQVVRFNGKTAKFMGVWVLPNANVLNVISKVRETLPTIERLLPPGMNLGVPYDSTNYITNALWEVSKTLLDTIIIVIIVIYIFIGSLRSVLVPVVAIPLSLIGSLVIMLLFGFSINLLTLLAIVLSVGLVVDDAIVMLENIERHVGQGMPGKQAAYLAVKELTGPIIAMTITLAAVYAPIGLQGGLTGVLFKEFAISLAGAVIISGFVALTLSPVMSSKLLKPNQSETKLKRYIDDLLSKLTALYRNSLTQVLNYKYLVLVVASFLSIACIPLYMFSSAELAPREDQGVVFGILQAAPNASIDHTAASAAEMQAIFESVPEYEKSFQITFPTNGFSGMLPKTWKKRKRTTEELQQELWLKSADVPGIRLIMTTPPPLPGGGNFPIEFVISSTADSLEVAQFADELVRAAFASNKFMFADSNLKYDLPQAKLIIDRDQLSSANFDLNSFTSQIATLTGGNYINRFSIAGRSYKVIPQLQRLDRLNPEQILNLYVKDNASNKLITVSTFADIEESVQPRELVKFQQLNSATIQGVIPPGVTLDAGLSALEVAAKNILPSDYSIDYAGESRQLRSEGKTLTQTLLFSFVLIFLVLAAQFESFRDPFVILLGSVPLALAAALIIIFVGGTTLNIYSQVGLVTLVGLVSKNGILIVEFANSLRAKGMDKAQAVIEAACTRLRPILMTSIATVMGHFPLLLVSGPGAGARNSIGAVLVSGMLIGTFFTLFVVPVIYLFIASREVNIEAH